MTDSEAKAEAWKRWGAGGYARKGKWMLLVGVITDRGFDCEYGRGETWADAFADADRLYAPAAPPSP